MIKFGTRVVDVLEVGGQWIFIWRCVFGTNLEFPPEVGLNSR